MSLVISLGTNLGDLEANLQQARVFLFEHFKLISESKIFKTKPVDYENQDAFLNQLIEFEIPNVDPQNTLELILNIEKKMGRVRKFKYGPRIIDIDIIFWGNQIYSSPNLQIPHPKYLEREFITVPFKSLPFLKKFSLRFEEKASKSIIKSLT